MIKAFAPRESGVNSWVWLSILLVGGFPVQTRSQSTNPAPDTKPAAAGEAEKPGGAVDSKKETAAFPPETFRIPGIEKLLENNFQQRGKTARPQVLKALREMAGQNTVDRPTMEQYVENYVAELTSRSNIKAILGEDFVNNPNAPAHKAMGEATSYLIEPILTARNGGHTSFLTNYNRVLISALGPLLEGHYFTRLEAIIVLAQTGSPEAVNLLLKQLTDPDQVPWVAMVAARGLTNIQIVNHYNLDTATAVKAAKVVSDYLSRAAAKDLPWPVQFRALEALGSLRQASSPMARGGEPEMAFIATEYLTDPALRIEVRSEAGWALGMMQVPAGIADFNYGMIAYSIGDVAALLAENVRDNYSKNVDQSKIFVGLLLNQIYQSFSGLIEARDSGLLHAVHPSLEKSRDVIRQVDGLIKPLMVSAVRLVREPPGQAKKNLAELETKISALKNWLQKNPPKSAKLVPNGKEFPHIKAQIVNANGGAARVANGPVVRGQ